MILNFFQQPQSVKIPNNLLSCLKPVHASVGCRGRVTDGCVLRQNVEQWQVMPLTHFIVVEIMGGGDLDAAGSELGIDKLGIGDDRDRPVEEGVVDGLSDQVLVAGVIGVDRDGEIEIVIGREALRGCEGDFSVFEHLLEQTVRALHAEPAPDTDDGSTA